MSARVLAALAAFSCAAALGGGVAALTAMPPIISALAGASLLVVALRDANAARRPAIVAGWAAAGALAGLLLPSTAPDAPGGVVTRAAGAGFHGDLFDVLDALDRDPAMVLDRSVTVTGRWTPSRGDDAATVSRRIVQCCAADAVDVGFDVRTSGPTRDIATGTLVRVRGVVRASMRDGEVRYVLERSVVTPP